MTRHLKRHTFYLGTAALLAVLACGGARSAAAADGAPVISRVRSDNPFLASLLRSGVERSATLRRLVDTIDATDGLVYLDEGQCRHGVRACLLGSVTIAGPHRVLRIVLDIHGAEQNLLGSIGHELRHAVEVLGAPQVRNQATMTAFYQREGWTNGSSFETHAAIDAGAAVRDEVRRNTPVRSRDNPAVPVRVLTVDWVCESL